MASLDFIILAWFSHHLPLWSSIGESCFFHYFLFFLHLLLVMERLISGWLFFSNQAAFFEIVFHQLLFKFHMLFFYPAFVHYTSDTQCLLPVPIPDCTVAVNKIYSCKSQFLLMVNEMCNQHKNVSEIRCDIHSESRCQSSRAGIVSCSHSGVI